MQTQSAQRTPNLATAAEKSPISRAVTPVGRFLAELGGMCAVMCVGGSIVSFVAFQIATWLGYPDLVQQSLYLSIVLVAVCLSLPMAIYMAVRGHGRRHNVEMTGTTIGSESPWPAWCGPGSFRRPACKRGVTSSTGMRSRVPAHDRRDVDQLQHVQRTRSARLSDSALASA